MALAVIALSCGVSPIAQADTAAADTATAPPYIERAVWGSYGNDLLSLRVYPTASGRAAAVAPVALIDLAEEAWGEVLALAPDAGTPGMPAQFRCHWQFAEYAEPGKTSWNLEPWRPVVGHDVMVSSGCNPDGPEEHF